MRIDNTAKHISKLNSQSLTSDSKQYIENQLDTSNNFDISVFDFSAIDYNKLTKSTLETLKKSYAGINIYILKSNSPADVKKLALGLGSGKHLVISQDFINKMGSSEESYNKGKAILEETLNQLSNSNFEFNSIGAVVSEDSIKFWTVYQKNTSQDYVQNSFIDPIKMLQQQGEELKNKFKTMKKNSSFNAPIEVYSKLSRAKSKPEVMNVVSTARANISKLKTMLRDCEDNEKMKIKAMIKQLEKAITRSYRKIRDLSNEESLSQEKRSAEIKEKKRLAAHKNDELNRRRAIRRIRERAQIDEANPLYYYPQILLNKDEDRKNEYIPTIDMSGISDALVMPVTDIFASGASALQGIEITVMPTIEISI